MKSASRFLVFAALLSMCYAGPSSAQYMKLISDNPTDPTRLRSSGTTILTVTLDTNHDKDGSIQTCNSHTAALGCGQATGNPLGLFSYAITLNASGGTVTWGTWDTSGANTSGTYSNLSPPATSTQVEITYVRDGDGSDPPGLYTLGSIPVTVASGSPRIEIARGPQPVDPGGIGTGFGGYCDANRFPNTYVLGDPGNLCATGDWFDADGVDGTAGTSAVTLAVLHEMVVAPGSTMDQAVSASDPDGAAITFSSAGPGFMTVTSNSQVGNTRTGTIHLAPPEGSSGTVAASVTASANGTFDTRNFTIRIRNIAPTLAQPNDMTVDEGGTADQALSATDPNGDPLFFSLAFGGARYASVTTTAPGSGSATGNIHLAPGFGDAGTATAVVGVSDGQSSDSKSLRITVNNVSQPPTLVQPTNMRVTAGSAANQTLRVQDPEADPVIFTMVSGPTFMTVSAAGNVHLAPGPDDPGTYAVIVRVSVGTLSDDKGFAIQVDAPNHPPVMAQPADMTVNVGETADQALSATDPDGYPLSFQLGLDPGGYEPPRYASVTTIDPGAGTATGNLHLAPTASNARDAVLRIFVVDGTHGINGLRDVKLVNVTVPGGPWPPAFPPICNMAVVEGSTADQEILVTDRYGSGNGVSFSSTGPAFMTLSPRCMCGSEAYSFATIHLAPPQGASGTYSATVTATYYFNAQSASQSFTITVTAAAPATPAALQADIFLTDANRVIRLSSPVTSWCAELEPKSSSFQVTDIVPSSIIASFGGAQIRATGTNRIAGDGSDGIPRLAGFFGKGDLRTLFAGLPDGSQTVNLLISGDLVGAGSFEGTASVLVEKSGSLAGAFGRASPNPFNPSTTISFELRRSGRVRLRVYDVSGRLVNTLADQIMGTGLQEVRWNGTKKDGSSVSSGVYFYILETPDRTVRNDIVVVK